MKEIVLLSGKGGVGKSSFTAALGTILAERHSIMLADTDVDTPNLHIVLGAAPHEVVSIRASDKAVIDYDLCGRCMQCLDICRFSSIIGAEEPIIIGYSCEGCGACALVCPDDAISIQSVVNGRLNVFVAEQCRVVTGELEIGESGSGRLVYAVRKRARLEAEKQGADLIITDGPAGIGCPVTAAMKGADFVILITEPTPSALQDLQRIAEVVSQFGIPAGVVLNRCDMHDAGRRRIRDYLEEKNLQLLAEIPSDPLLPAALAEGRLAIDAYPDASSSTALRRLGKMIEDRLM